MERFRQASSDIAYDAVMASKHWTERLPATKSKAELAYESLRAAIADGDLRPGERINMDEMARMLGISKIPIREAVKRLESEGLVDSRVHSGAVVATVDQREMRGVFLAREVLESLAGELAARQVDDGLLAELEHVQREMRAELDRGAIERLPELNSEFHRALARASGYRILSELTEQLLLTIRRYRVTAPKDERNWRSVVREHDGIIAALRTADPDAVVAAVRAHTRSQADHEVAD